MRKNLISRPVKNYFNTVSSFTFNNGLNIYTCENHKAPTVTVQAWIKTGSIHENKNIGCGLSHFLEHMIFQGSRKYPQMKIAETVNAFGGEINAYTSYGATVFYMNLPSEFYKKAIDILCDAVQKPLFPKDRFSDEKNIILRERDANLDNPTKMLSEQLWLNMFRIHPVRHPVIGYKEKIKSVNKKMITEYYLERYIPQRVFFVVCGDIETEAVVDCLSQKLSTWARGSYNYDFLPEEPTQSQSRHAEFPFTDPLSRIAVGYHIPEVSSPDIPALDIISGILAHGKSSRLINNLCNKQHVAINIDAFSYTTYFPGISGIAAMCSPEKLDSLRDGIFAEISKLIEHKVSQQELNRIIGQQATDFLRNIRSNSSVAQIIGDSVLSFGTPYYAGEYLERIIQVTKDDISRVAGKYLVPENSTVIEMVEDKKRSREIRKNHKIDNNNKSDVILKTFKNGQRLILMQDNTFPLIDLCLVIPGGTIYESCKNSGITQLIASMLSAGTKKYSETELSEKLGDNAINLNISGGNNTLTFRLNCRSDALQAAVDIFTSILSEPLFPESEFKRDKENHLEQLKSRKLHPQYTAENLMCSLLFQDHPYSRSRHGTEKSVAGLTVDDLRHFYFSQCLVPNKAVFGIAGDIGKDIDTVIETIIDRINWNRSPVKNDIPKPLFKHSAVTETVNVPREQAVIFMGVPGCDIVSNDRFALDIFQTSLNGVATRLFKTIRENAGLAYHTGLFSLRGLHPGFLAFYAGTYPEAVDEVIRLFNKERLTLVKKGLTKKEFQAAKSSIKYELAEQKQQFEVLIFDSVLAEYYGNGYLEPWNQEKIFEKIDLKTTNQIIRKYLDCHNIVISVATPASS